ncbi:MAG: hypothetical protein AAB387_06660 [candidate division NC10 bacterium]
MDADVEVCGRIIYDAFKDIAERHGFPPAFASVEVGARVAKLFIGLPAIWSFLPGASRRPSRICARSSPASRRRCWTP